MENTSQPYLITIQMTHGEPQTLIRVLVDEADSEADAAKQGIESQLHSEPNWEDDYNCTEDGGGIAYSVRNIVPVDPDDYPILIRYL